MKKNFIKEIIKYGMATTDKYKYYCFTIYDYDKNGNCAGHHYLIKRIELKYIYAGVNLYETVFEGNI